MTCVKVYNNNIILAGDDGREVVALGKGIGFGLKPGAPVNPVLVQKIFVFQENPGARSFKDVLPDLPYEHVLLASRVVDFGRDRLKTVLNQSIIIALADHLSFVIKRLADGLEIQAPLAWDIKHIYPAEYAVGMDALEIMRRETGVTFPPAEAAAVALHFINAESDAPDMPGTMRIAGVIQDCVTAAEAHLGRRFDEASPDFIGFVTQLRATVLAFLHPVPAPRAPQDDKLYAILRSGYPFEMAGAEKIAGLLEQKRGWILSRNDLCFITLYLSRLKEA